MTTNKRRLRGGTASVQCEDAIVGKVIVIGWVKHPCDADQSP